MLEMSKTSIFRNRVVYILTKKQHRLVAFGTKKDTTMKHFHY